MILFVDDEPNFIQYCAYALEREGYDVAIVTRPSDAIEMIKERGDIEVIILDMMLPSDIYKRTDTKHGRLTGKLLLNDIRKINPKVPIILHSVVIDPDLVLGPNIFYMSKIEAPPSRLVDFVKTLKK